MPDNPETPVASATRRQMLAATAAGAAPLAVGDASAASGPDPEAVRAAVDASRSYLLDARDGDHWASNASMGEDARWDLRINCYYALLLDHLDANPESKRAAVDWILGRRRSGGGWNDPVVNFAGLLLLRRLGGYDDVVADVETENEEQGFALVDDERGFGEELSTGLLRVKLLYLVVGDEYDRGELLPRRGTRRFLGLMRMTAAFEGDDVRPTKEFVHQPFVDLMLATGNLLAATEDDPSDAADVLAELTTRLLLQRRAPNGVWSMSIDNVFASFALSESGYGVDDPEIRRAIDYLRDTWQTPSGRLVPWKLPVFDTGWAMQALVTSGVSPDHDALTDAAQWLFDARIASPASEREDVPLDFPRPRPPFREHWAQGWGYKPHTITDWDDTAVAIYGWGPYDERAVQDEIEFLRSVQRPDGAWATWHDGEITALDEADRQRIGRQFGREFWEHVSWLFADPPSIDITGHALLALGEHGHTVDDDETARRAVDWLLDQQDDDDLWRSPRDPGVVYGTSRAILGMAAVDADLDRPEVAAATDRLLDRRRADGSWGEPHVAPIQTARVVQTLLAAGLPPDHDAVEAGVGFLVDAQRDDGSWKPGRFMKVLSGYPYDLSVFAQAEALTALSEYAEARAIPYQPDEGRSLLDRLADALPLVGAGAVALFAGVAALRRRG